MFGDFEQRRIKLHERIINGAIAGMAGLTLGGCGRRRFGRLFVTAKGEEPPFRFRKSAFIFDLGFDGDEVSLKMSILIDRTLSLRGADFQDEHCLIWPLARLHKSTVCLGRDKYVVEARLGRAAGLFPRPVCHAQS